MSCETQLNKASRASRLAGLSSLSNKTGGLVGGLAMSAQESLTTAGRRAGAVAFAGAEKLARAEDAVTYGLGPKVSGLNNRLLETLDRPTTMAANAAPYLLAGSALGRGGVYAGLKAGTPAVGGIVTLRPLGQMARHLTLLSQGRKVAQTLSLNRLLVSAAAGASRSRSERVRTYELKSGDKTVSTVRFWKSPKLTTWLNRGDLSGAHALGQNLSASFGDLVQAEPGGVWHRGTSVFKTPTGRRTLTHLRSLGLPSRHLYFERKLTDEQVSSLITGRVKPSKLPGYVGEISAMESLAPAWAMTKGAMITNRIYHPPAVPEWKMKNEK